jgi:hypothetical protein
VQACDPKAFAKLSKRWGWDLLERADAEDRRKRKGKEKLDVDDAEQHEEEPPVRRPIRGGEQDDDVSEEEPEAFQDATGRRRMVIKDKRWRHHEQTPWDDNAVSYAHPVMDPYAGTGDAFPAGEFYGGGTLEPVVDFVAPIPEPPAFAADCLLLVRIVIITPIYYSFIIYYLLFGRTKYGIGNG